MIISLLSVVWGLSFLFIKKLTVAYSGIEIGAGRILIAGIFLLPWAFKYYRDLPLKKSPYIFVIGMLGYLLPGILFGIVGSKISSSLSGTLNATTPIFVLLGGALFFREKIYKYQVLGIALGFLGSFVLVSGGSGVSFDWTNPYAALVLLATFLYGLNTNILSFRLEEVRPIVISSFSLAFMIVPAFVTLWFTDFFSKILAPENRMLLVYFLILGMINSGLAAVLYNYLLKITSAVFASSVTYIMPIVAVIAGMFDGENIGWIHLFGMAVILISVFILNKKENPVDKLKPQVAGKK